MKEQINNSEYLKQILLTLLNKQHFQLQRIYTRSDSVRILNNYLDELLQLVDMPIKDIMKLYTTKEIQQTSNKYFNIQEINKIKSVISNVDKECSKFKTAFQQCEYIINNLTKQRN